MQRAGEPLGQCGDGLAHPVRKAAKSRFDFRTRRLDAEQLRGAALLDRLKRLSRPHRRSARLLAHDVIADSELGRELGQFGLAREEAVGAAFDDKPLHLLGHDHSAGTALGLEHGDVDLAVARQLPCRHETGNAGTNDHDLHPHPRSAAAARTASATAATRPGSSLSDAVRSSWMPSRFASA